MATQRWVLYDPVADESWTMPINPDSMKPVPVKARNMRHAVGHPKDPQTRTFVAAPEQRPWGWAGVIRTEAHYAELLRWARKGNPIVVTDHLDRLFTVVLTSFQPTDRRPTQTVTWRLRYAMDVVLLAGPTAATP